MDLSLPHSHVCLAAIRSPTLSTPLIIPIATKLSFLKFSNFTSGVEQFRICFTISRIESVWSKARNSVDDPIWSSLHPKTLASFLNFRSTYSTSFYFIWEALTTKAKTKSVITAFLITFFSLFSGEMVLKSLFIICLLFSNSLLNLLRKFPRKHHFKCQFLIMNRSGLRFLPAIKIMIKAL